MATILTPSTYTIYGINEVLSLCENEDFSESFHDYLQNSDYSYGSNGDTLIAARDFNTFFHEFCEEYAEVYPKGSINHPQIQKFFSQLEKDSDKQPTFVSLGC